MASHYVTKNEKIAKLAAQAQAATKSREELWRALYSFLNGECSKEHATGVLNANTYCSCGRHASCWDGKYNKMCETCMST